VALRDHHGRTDLRRAALKRLNDAKALLRVGKPHARGAAYLAGYAIECKLKAIAMEVFGCWTLEQLARRLRVTERDVYTHGLEALLRALPLYATLRRSQLWRSDFAGRVNQWRVSWRYDPHDADLEWARSFLEAAERVYNWLEANRA
jgi:HEPN domain-containing protein